MRWLSPPERVPDDRDNVRYSKPTSTKNISLSLISFRMLPAISSCFGVSVFGSAANHSFASKIENSPTSLM